MYIDNNKTCNEVFFYLKNMIYSHKMKETACTRDNEKAELEL